MRYLARNIIIVFCSTVSFAQTGNKHQSALPGAKSVENTDSAVTDSIQYWKQEKQSDAIREKLIHIYLKNQNGIEVMEPQLYDNALLQRMLAAAQARLALLNVIDQNSVTSRLGVLSGSTSKTDSIAIGVQGPSLPQISTTQASPTAAPATTATETPQPPPPLNLPTSAVPLPANPSSSASDTLREEMQLSDEIANLTLLLEGPISSSLANNTGDSATQKPKVTVGIPVMIAPRKQYRNAVAVVEAFITSNTAQQKPSVSALLPREKTYNVAGITEKNMSISGTMPMQVASVSGGFLRSRKSYYVVQDQDTLASTFDVRNETNNEVGVWWLFRPVLGQALVKSGPRLTFVQLALPSGASNSTTLGTVSIDTYWRRLDRKTGAIGQVIPGSYSNDYIGLDTIPIVSLRQEAPKFNASSLEDLHNGQLAINLQGNFLQGTYIRIGSQKFLDASTGLTFENQRLEFSAPVLSLANNRLQLVSRDGSETAISFGSCVTAPEYTVSTVEVDETHTKIKLSFTRWPAVHSTLKPLDTLYAPKDLPLVLVIGGKAYGPTEPLVVKDRDISVIVPTTDLIAIPTMRLVTLFTDDAPNPSGITKCSSTEVLADYSLPERGDRFVYLGAVTAASPIQPEDLAIKDRKPAKPLISYALFGSRLRGATVLYPDGVKLFPFTGAGADNDDSIQRINIAADMVADNGLQVLIAKVGQAPVVVQMPSPPKKPTNSTAATPAKAREPIVIGSDQATITGSGLEEVQTVLFGTTSIPFEKQKDDAGTTILLKDLSAQKVSTLPGSKTLSLTLPNDKKLL